MLTDYFQPMRVANSDLASVLNNAYYLPTASDENGQLRILSIEEHGIFHYSESLFNSYDVQKKKIIKQYYEICSEVRPQYTFYSTNFLSIA